MGDPLIRFPEATKLHSALASDFENNNHAIEGIDCRSRRAVRSAKGDHEKLVEQATPPVDRSKAFLSTNKG